jgi:hypothetical protein
MKLRWLIPVIEASVCAAVAGFCMWLYVAQGFKQRGRKRAAPTKPTPSDDREPTTVDELVNTVSTAGPVTLVLSDETRPKTWN